MILKSEERSAAFHDDLLEARPRFGNGGQIVAKHTAGGLAENRYVGRVSAERINVFVHPFQRLYCVKDPEVVAVGIFVSIALQHGKIKLTENAQPVIDGDHNSVFAVGQIADKVVTIERSVICAAGHKAAAMDKKHDRLSLCFVILCPDVQR